MRGLPENQALRCKSTSKVCLSKKDAYSKKNFLIKKIGKKNLRIYHCLFCNFWHLTHQDKNYENRI